MDMSIWNWQKKKSVPFCILQQTFYCSANEGKPQRVFSMFSLPQVSYVSLYTRETFSKVGRELLGAIAGVHTQIISVLLDRVRETIEKVGMVRADLSFKAAT